MDNLPSAFIVGAPKCGTTMLFEYLNLHSSCYFPEKEMHFFNTDLPTRHWDNLGAYLDRFKDAPDQAVLGDASVWYLYSENAVRSILDFNPDARFVVMLRNPVKAAEALHGELLLDGREDLHDFEVAWRSMEKRREIGGSVNSQLQYGDVYRYAPQLERLFSIVPKKQVKVLILEEFSADAENRFLEVMEFLGAEGGAPQSFERVNSSKRIRSRFLHNMVFAAPRRFGKVYGVAKFVANSIGFRPGEALLRFHEEHNVSTGPRRAISLNFKKELNQYFSSDVEGVEDILGRQLVDWRRDMGF